MKAHTTALLSLCIFTKAYSQPNQCYSYDYLKAKKAIRACLFRKDNFELFSDDLAGHEVFNRKQELRHKSTIIPIPVLHFELNSLASNADTQFSSLFATDYSQFCAFLLHCEGLANIVRSSPPHFKSNRIESVGADDSATAVKVYDIFKNNKYCIFFDAPRFRYAYFENNNYVYYDIEKKSIITLSLSDYVADYKRYFNLK